MPIALGRRPPAPATARTGGSGWLDRPVAAAAISLAGWAGFVVARLLAWAHGDISRFIMSGVKKYSHPRAMWPPIGHVPLSGYDGQFYYRLALAPFTWRHTAYGITMDHAYRYTRLGYPLLAWALSLGQARLLPLVLVAVNLACMATIGWLGAIFARDAGRHALWGLLLVAYFGTVISVGRDTAEPLTDALMLGGLLALRRERWLLATASLCCAVVTNETMLVLPAAILLTRLFASRITTRRISRRDLAWLVPGCAWALLQGIEHVVVRWQTGASADVSRNLGPPFQGMERGLRADVRLMSWSHLGTHDINLIEFAALAAVVLAGFLVLGSTAAPAWERAAFAGFVLTEMVLATWQFWGSTFGDGRAYVDCYLLAMVLLISAPSDGTRPAVTGKRLATLAAIAVAALVVVARRRILFE